MKKIKERMAKAKAAINIQTYQKPMFFVISIMITINVVILLVAALITWLMDPNYPTFVDALAKGSIVWMLTPNAIMAIENPKTLFLAFLVFITGLVLFSGTIIALTTNAIREYFQKKKSGSGKVLLENHILVLNWNNKVPELVTDLLHMEQKNIYVMILAEINKEYAEKQIQTVLMQSQNKHLDSSKVKVLVKNGDPLSTKDLHDVSIEKAKSILIMNKEMHEIIHDDLSKSDLNVIKVLLNLGTVELPDEVGIVAEIKKIETKDKILTMARVVQTLKNKVILPICFDRRLGQIIAQTIIDPRIEDVYLSMFSFEGSEIYGLTNMDFEDYLKKSVYGIPISKIGDQLYVLAPSAKKSHLVQEEVNTDMLPLKGKIWTEKTSKKVFVFGQNNKLPFILESFGEYEKIHQSSFHATWADQKDMDSIVEEINQTKENVTIVLLSDEKQQLDSLDANVIDLLIELENKVTNKDVHIIVELLDPKNDAIIRDFPIQNTIISNKIISLLLSKLALFKKTAPFYENLLTIAPSGGFEDDQSIAIHSAKECFDEQFPIVFSSSKAFIRSCYYAQKKKAIPIGFERQGKITLFDENLLTSQEIVIESEDIIVWINL